MDNGVIELLVVMGAGVIRGAAVLGPAGRANAALVGADATARPQTTPPGIVSISSPSEAGVSYRFASWLETSPLNDFLHGRLFSPPGVYNGAGSDLLGTTFDLPPGVLVHDVEVYCSAQVSTFATVAIWSTGATTLTNVIAGPTQIGPFGDSALHATNIAVPTAGNGPFPHGTKVAVFLATLAAGTIGLNGFRLGLKSAPLSPVLLAAPVRVYDTQTSHAPLAGGATRTISLASHLPIGASGALYTVSVYNTNGGGALSCGAGGPATLALGLQWSRTGDQVSAPMTSAVSSTRQIKIHSVTGSGTTDFFVDLTGYLV